MKDKDFHCKPPEEYTWRIEVWSEDNRLFVGAYPDLSPELAKEQAKRIFDRFVIDAKSVVAVPVVGYPPVSEEYWEQERLRLSILLQPVLVVAAQEVLDHDGKASKLKESQVNEDLTGYYEQAESPEIIESFLRVVKSMPVINEEYDSIYSEEELDEL